MIKRAFTLLLLSSKVYGSCEIDTILPLIRPGAEWSLAGNLYSGLTWLDKKSVKPSLTEVRDAVSACKTQEIAVETQKRQAIIDAKNVSLTAEQRLDALTKVLGL